MAAILAFGATNIWHRWIIPLTTLREIILHFGELFHILTVNFRQELLDMEIFQDRDDNSLINNTELLTLLAYTIDNTVSTIDNNEFDDYDAFDDDDHDVDDFDMLQQFRGNAENLIIAINNNNVETVRQISFRFILNLTPPTYNRLHALFDERVNDLVAESFGGLSKTRRDEF